MRLPIKGVVTIDDICRLWSCIDKKREDECWPWIGSISTRKNGKLAYPSFGMNKKIYKATRIIYHLVYNIDPEELEVCHSCNNTICCNPKHFYLGTHAVNMAHASRDGLFLSKKGIRNDNCRLSKEDVDNIRRLRKLGWKLRQLSDEYGVTKTHISYICNYHSWS